MNDFHSTLSYINDLVYQPNGLKIHGVQEEIQNAKYGAGVFQLSSKTVRFRVAKVTPTKIGQFVAFWEKDEYGKNKSFSYEEAPDLLVVTTFRNENDFGQFVFPKHILLKQHVLHSDSVKGKMGMRVYPSWDHPTSKEAIKTQQWQLPYFIEIRSDKQTFKQIVMELYS